MPQFCRRVSALFAFFVLALAALASAAPAMAKDWSTTVSRTANGSYMLGNPKAANRLVAWVSYTCSHCAAFDAEAMGPLRKTYLRSGSISLEVRNLLRDPADTAAAMLARCQGSGRFFAHHAAIMDAQRDWFGRAVAASPTEQRRWMEGTPAERMAKVSRATGLESLMASRGVSVAAQQKCLADTAMLDTIVAMTADAGEKWKIRGTPSFALNGKLVEGVHDWSGLKPRLDSLMK